MDDAFVVASSTLANGGQIYILRFMQVQSHVKF
jgi:hypothetical protein